LSICSWSDLYYHTAWESHGLLGAEVVGQPEHATKTPTLSKMTEGIPSYFRSPVYVMDVAQRSKPYIYRSATLVQKSQLSGCHGDDSYSPAHPLMHQMALIKAYTRRASVLAGDTNRFEQLVSTCMHINMHAHAWPLKMVGIRMQTGGCFHPDKTI